MNVNTTQLAKILGITRQYVNKLVKHEGFPKAARGKYELEKAIKWYLEFRESEIENKYKTKLQKYENDDPQQRLNRYKADGELLNLLERQNKLLPVEEIARTWKNEIQALKQKAYNLPNKVAHKCLTAQSKNQVSEILTQSLDEVFEEYANEPINIPTAYPERNNSNELVSIGERVKRIRKA